MSAAGATMAGMTFKLLAVAAAAAAVLVVALSAAPAEIVASPGSATAGQPVSDMSQYFTVD